MIYHNRLVDNFGLQGGREHLDELVSLATILDDERNEGGGRAGLKLGAVPVLLDLDGTGILTVNQGQKVFNVGGLFRLRGK